jgi:hypothetical protein
MAITQIDTESLACLLAVAHAALTDPRTLYLISKKLAATPETMGLYIDLVEELMQEFDPESQAEAKSDPLDINLNKHLDTFSFIIALETARLALGNRVHRKDLLPALSIDDDAAENVYRRLCALMAEVYATQRKLGNKQFPSLETGE